MRRYDGWLPCSLNKHKGLRGCIVACSCGAPLRRHGHDQLKGRSSRNGGGCRGGRGERYQHPEMPRPNQQRYRAA